MIIFLYGSDGYRLKENVDAIADSYQKKHKSGVNLYRFNFASDRNYNDLTSAVKSVSFFEEVKLVIVKNVFDNKIYSENIVVLIKDFNLDKIKDVVLVLVEDKIQKDLEKRNKDLFSLLNSKNNLVRNIGFLSGSKLSDWVKSKFKGKGHNVSSAVVGLLIDIVGNPAPEQARCGTGDSWALANEIEKLSNYLTGKTCHDRSCLLTESDINLLVSRKENNSIFDLVDAVGNQNKARAFEMMYKLINSGHDPHYLLSMLVYHFENLLSVFDSIERGSPSSAQVIAKQCGLHPFVARKAVSQAGKFIKNDLLLKFNRLAGLDIASKNGQVNLEDALFGFVLS